FDAMLRGYEHVLDIALGWKRTTLLIFFATLALSVYLFVIIPKGFFPQQDTGVIVGFAEAGQDVSATEMARLPHALTDVVARDPD
ncbi:efflux RND transporter permease subunit, partial [Enterobacter hormaechei]|uniref:efflux RND transporter permease subunit n=1 Tax=Enterobacter hormaechei TaxID=158836 RepID=UPI0013D84BB2